MAKRPPNDGAGWSARELNTLKALAKAGTPTSQVAKSSAAPRLRSSRRRFLASPSALRSAPGLPAEVAALRNGLSVVFACVCGHGGVSGWRWGAGT